MTSFAGDEFAQCGAPVGLFKDLFTNARHVREICIETLRQENQKKKQEELEEIQRAMKKVDNKLKAVAYSYESNRVYCESRTPFEAPSKERTKECRELLASKNALITRMDYLMGWDRKLTSKKVESTKEVELGCPNKEELQKIKAVRYFNKKLYQTWERCVVLRAEDFSLE